MKTIKLHRLKTLMLLLGVLYIPEGYAEQCHNIERIYHYQIKACQNSQGNYIASTEQGVGLLNSQAQEVIPFIYTEIGVYKDGVSVAKNKASHYGLLDEHGKQISLFQYQFIGEFKEGLAPASRMINNKEKWGYLNLQGKEVIPFIYDITYYFTDGLALAKINGKYYQIDKKGGKKVIQQQFEMSQVLRLNDDLMVISDDKNNERYYGAINHAGKIIVPMQYDAIDVENTIIRAHQNHRSIDYYNKKGEKLDNSQNIDTIVKLKDDYSLFNEKIDNEQRSEKYGVIDKMGKIIIPADYHHISMIGEDAIVANKNIADKNDESQVFLFNAKGRLLYQAKNMEIRAHDAKSDYAIIKQSVMDKNTGDEQEYYGLLKLTGEVVIPAQYYNMNWRHDYLEVMNEQGKIGLADKNNRMIIDFERYDYMLSLESKTGKSLFKVVKNQVIEKGIGIGEVKEYYGVVNEQGIEILAPIYEEIQMFDDFIKVVQIKDGRRKTGLFNLDASKQILATEYEEIDKIEHSPYFMVKSLTGHFGLFDIDGKAITETIYDDIQQVNVGYILIKDRKWGILDRKGQWVTPLSQDLELIDVPVLFKNK